MACAVTALVCEEMKFGLMRRVVSSAHLCFDPTKNVGSEVRSSQLIRIPSLAAGQGRHIR